MIIAAWIIGGVALWALLGFFMVGAINRTGNEDGPNMDAEDVGIALLGPLLFIGSFLWVAWRLGGKVSRSIGARTDLKCCPSCGGDV